MRLLTLLFCAALALASPAQYVQPLDRDFEQSQRTSGFEETADGNSSNKKDVPEGIYAWTVDPRFGSIRPADYDTIPHGFQNENATDGPRGHYNYTGNLSAPRISRLFTGQGYDMQQAPFIFFRPYDYFLRPTGEWLFTNTKSPFTNMTYHSCGNKTNGEDRLTALFSVNSGKKLGFGGRADYAYGRGYYEGQSTAHFDGALFASYLGEQYKLHVYAKRLFLKTRENGGIENDDYINRPERFPTRYSTADMPVNLARAWNKMEGTQLFLTHSYSLGFRRYRDAKGREVKAPVHPALQTTDSPANPPATEGTAPTGSTRRQPRLPRLANKPGEQDDGKRSSAARRRALAEQAEAQEDTPDSLKITSEFIPVSSFIHTLRITDNVRRFQSHERNNADNPGYFENFFLPGDSANDRTHHLGIENTLGVELHEGFNRWMKMGLRLFGKHEYARFDFREPNSTGLLPQRVFHENYFTVGAQVLSQRGPVVRYNLLGEIRTTGTDWGEFNIEADASLSLPFRTDSLHFDFNGFLRNERPSFYFRHYYARNAWWTNNDLDKQLRTRLCATLRYRRTALTASLENIQNYIYFQETLTPFTAPDGFGNYRHGVKVAQSKKNTQLVALTLSHGFRWGILHWDNELTWQTSTQGDVLPVPALSAYSNLYLLFRIARVLRTELGTDVRYFTRYDAPAYSPLVGQYAVQDAAHRVAIGNYPIVNAYVNFHLKRTRFYIMATHLNYSAGAGNPFLVPHYPLNRMVVRIGLSWNFVN